jgi:hypothetical protein
VEDPLASGCAGETSDAGQASILMISAFERVAVLRLPLHNSPQIQGRIPRKANGTTRIFWEYSCNSLHPATTELGWNVWSNRPHGMATIFWSILLPISWGAKTHFSVSDLRTK